MDITRLAKRGFFFFLLGLLLYMTIVEYLLFNTSILMPLQELETWVVSSIQTAFGINAVSSGCLLTYPNIGLRLVISPLCTGIREIALFLIVIIPLASIPLKKRLISTIPFIAIILLENIFRISLLYPIARDHGFEVMDISHDFMWAYGQMIVLLGLLVLWFYLFVFRPSKLEEATKDKKKTNTENT